MAAVSLTNVNSNFTMKTKWGFTVAADEKETGAVKDEAGVRVKVVAEAVVEAEASRVIKDAWLRANKKGQMDVEENEAHVKMVLRSLLMPMKTI